MRDFIDKYVPYVGQRRDLRCSPFFAQSLKGLPPALIILAGFDPLYDEGEAYAARLKAEGVPVTVTRFPGQMHGFLSRPKLLPKSLDEKVARLHLAKIGVRLTELKKDQADYIGVKVEGPFKSDQYRY